MPKFVWLAGLAGAMVAACAATGPAQQSPAAQTETHMPSRAGYLGDSACLDCHRQQSSTYLHTGHHRTSQFATPESMPASLRNRPAILSIVDPATASAEPGLYFKIEAKDGSYFESAFTGFGTDLQQRTEKIDIITGSGRRGQTYLYWESDRLLELPVSYWSDGQRWINSPGYQNGSADFSRPVNPGCMECHSTYVQALSSDPLTNRYDRDSLVPGISCETCHGPGAAHVAKQKAPGAVQPPAILNPAKFSRDHQVELCALCHNGIQRQETAPAFSYLPGEPLTNYFKPIPSDSVEHPDVHGNQVGLLERSRCYRESAKMSCSTCHDVHKPEQAAASYSQRCLGCHRPQNCSVVRRLGLKNAGNCIDCHMPVEPTSVIVSETAGKEVRATMRNHWIKVYPQVRR